MGVQVAAANHGGIDDGIIVGLGSGSYTWPLCSTRAHNNVVNYANTN